MNKSHFYIKIAAYGYTHPEGFNKKQLLESLDINAGEAEIINQYFSNAWNNSNSGGSRETLFCCLSGSIEEGEFIIKSETLFNYIDYLELQETRQSSKQAKIWAIIAIVLNVVAIGVQIYTSVSTQIDKGQFEEMKSIIQSIK